MFFLEELRAVTKAVKDAAGLGNSSCVMPFHTQRWKQTAVCEAVEPLQEYIDSLPAEKCTKYRIISNEPDMNGF
jgi:hypothetical protein